LTVEFEDAQGLTLPRIYVSTAITSGGHFRNKALSGKEVIARNNRSATLIMTALVENKAPHLAALTASRPRSLPTSLTHSAPI
jgi:hypothetical protein